MAVQQLDAHKIKADVWLLSGRYDEATTLSTEPWFKHNPRVWWITFENSSHMAHWEERERYIEVTGAFLPSTTP
ncbi:uncharacterized protein THITE_2086434 [Thermothielavioides terrestris NRRL 8126]|uniref:AB hydrolase-1 domain-containing protein n=1 Tax=Thermothielavioides terrestris (strain ATCC 38088 / NRRL 8126) TaxID=578455 RepID=G2R1W4_THETT|nr:uncharacterized protein THITE_2086434 [Thermothielavioides terrestris NRRL 8126]AEO64940.1 hypothetical protein THITE_2086434 [Thermothielavioides terrestris NRRL 8126]